MFGFPFFHSVFSGFGIYFGLGNWVENQLLLITISNSKIVLGKIHLVYEQEEALKEHTFLGSSNFGLFVLLH